MKNEEKKKRFEGFVFDESSGKSVFGALKQRMFSSFSRQIVFGFPFLLNLQFFGGQLLFSLLSI